MKHILFLTYNMPYPLDSGGKIRAYYLMKLLSSHYRIHCIYFYRHVSSQNYESKLKKICSSVKGFYRRPVFSIENLRYIHRYPFTASLYMDYNVSRFIDTYIQKGIDAVHFESFYTSVYMKKERPVLQMLGTENIEWKIYKEYVLERIGIPIKQLFLLEVSRMRLFEINTWNMADHILAVSEDDTREIVKYSKTPISIVQNGVDIDFFASIHGSYQSNTLLFVGNFTYIQNKDAVLYLLGEEGRELLNWFNIHIVGKYPSSDIIAMVHQLNNRDYKGKITVSSNISDIRQAYSNVFALIAPLRIGSGTKFKVLEAMASGVPVITTKVGCEGINVQNNKHLMVRESLQEMIQAAKKLKENKVLYQRIVANARKMVQRKYSWDSIEDNLINAYEKAFHSYR